MERKHTIVLLQPASNKATRTYMDFETVSSAMDGICKMFEKKLKELNPTVSTLSYEIEDLNRYIDSLPQLVALVQGQNNAYTPQDKEWIKKRIYVHLRNQAS
ncbi:enhancer of rudimentary-like protein [Chloropicon primus]|uniref:Enhancer of rudimentary homolog n=1 Tax=Chloropicon primus TaxID=1764295 RepID=A0A5B8MGR8_9CHLO|nr:enhancer of rudimentary-like protein [Chloropicon primus]UPQ98483.1 enhancer of rudimentary-like protein [Chloropicon primus]|eukprot:QDZ19274.1 enhancer of rudimentary-like protein [Chloropicon primus]